MNENDSVMIKGSYRSIEGLSFNHSEMNIKRNIRLMLLSNIAYLLICALLFTACIFSYKNGKNELFYISLFYSLITLIILVIGILKLTKARKINKRIFSFSEIRCLSIDKKDNKLDMSFEFKDGLKDRIWVEENEKFKPFIKNLKMNSVEINENR